MGIFGIQTGEWASIRAWASNRDFTVIEIEDSTGEEMVKRPNNVFIKCIRDEIVWLKCINEMEDSTREEMVKRPNNVFIKCIRDEIVFSHSCSTMWKCQFPI